MKSPLAIAIVWVAAVLAVGVFDSWVKAICIAVAAVALNLVLMTVRRTAAAKALDQ